MRQLPHLPHCGYGPAVEQSYINLMSMKNQDDNIKLAGFVSKMFPKRENNLNRPEKINVQVFKCNLIIFC